MKHFEIHLDDEEEYHKGLPVFLGSVLGHQSPERYINGKDFLIIVFSGGAQAHIPSRRIRRILEG